jgi:hypothetical protein
MRRTGYNTTEATQDADRSGRISRSKAIVVILLVLALPLLWRWTPLHDWVNLQTIIAWQRSVKNDPAAPLYIVAVYLVGSLFFFPITILNLATVFAFWPGMGKCLRDSRLAFERDRRVFPRPPYRQRSAPQTRR